MKLVILDETEISVSSLIKEGCSILLQPSSISDIKGIIAEDLTISQFVQIVSCNLTFISDVLNTLELEAENVIVSDTYFFPGTHLTLVGRMQAPANKEPLSFLSVIRTTGQPINVSFQPRSISRTN